MSGTTSNPKCLRYTKYVPLIVVDIHPGSGNHTRAESAVYKPHADHTVYEPTACFSHSTASRFPSACFGIRVCVAVGRRSCVGDVPRSANHASMAARLYECSSDTSTGSSTRSCTQDTARCRSWVSDAALHRHMHVVVTCLHSSCTSSSRPVPC